MAVEDRYQEITSDVAVDDAISQLGGASDTAQGLKDDLQGNPSVVSRNRLIMWLVAMAMEAHRILWRIYRSDVRELALNGFYGTKRWWVQKALEFQLGYDLTFTDKDAFYDTIDEDARVVAQASVDESAFKVILKAVKLEGTAYTKLSANELTGLQDYCSEIAPAGIKIEARSVDPDRLKLIGQVICDAKQGLINIESNASAAIDQYLVELDFNGVFSINKLRQAVLAVPGVIDVKFNTVEARSASQTSFVSVPRIRRTFAGWMKLDLTSNLEYLSSNV